MLLILIMAQESDHKDRFPINAGGFIGKLIKAVRVGSLSHEGRFRMLIY